MDPPAEYAVWRQFGLTRTPRFVGNPMQQIVVSADELCSFFTDNNGKRDCFVSTYCFPRYDAVLASGTVVMDNLWCDFDSRDLTKPYEDVRMAVSELHDAGIAHVAQLFSGQKGFHLHIPLTPTVMSTKRAHALVLRAHRWFFKYPTFDRGIVGDIRRLRRMPMSIHPKTGLKCIPVDVETQTLQEILSAARDGSMTSVDLAPNPSLGPILTDEPRPDPIIITQDRFREDYPDLVRTFLPYPCLLNAIMQAEAPHRARAFMVILLQHAGLSAQEVGTMVHGIGHTYWSDYDAAVTQRHVDDIILKRYKWPTCDAFRSTIGGCIGRTPCVEKFGGDGLGH